MMGIRTPEICWNVNKHQVINWKFVASGWLIYLNCMIMHGLTNFKFRNRFDTCAQTLLRNRLQATSRVDDAGSTWHGAELPQFLTYLSLNKINPLNPELNPICYLLTLLAHHFLHFNRIMVKSLTFRLLMSYIYGAHILDVSRSHTTTHHIR